ncbi:wax ester synthase/diacylglycerol acyltransferase 3-like [Wolffia australiana]
MGYYDEAVSPKAWLFLQPGLPHVIHCTISFQDPIDVPALKASLSSGFIKNCPRLRSLVATDDKGQGQWMELPSFDIDKHVIIMSEEEEDDLGERSNEKKRHDEEENDAYIDRFVNSLLLTSTMRTDIPLWDVHIMPRRRRCFVLRLHHALGDFLSLIAPLFASFDSKNSTSTMLNGVTKQQRLTMGKISFVTKLVEGARRSWRSMMMVWNTIPYVAVASLLSMRLKEDKTIMRGQTRAVGMPRTLTSLTLSLEDMKIVKNKVNATINDVFLGITACGLRKYFNLISEESSNLGCLTALNVVSLRKEGLEDLIELIVEDKAIKWGNNIGHFLLGFDLREEYVNPLTYVQKAKEMLDTKKMSYEAQASHDSSELMISMFGSRVYVDLACSMLSGITFMFSNVKGPPNVMGLGKNNITEVGFTTNGLPVPIDVRMISYNGKAFLKILTATKLIHDPKLLCMCIKDALKVMMIY